MIFGRKIIFAAGFFLLMTGTAFPMDDGFQAPIKTDAEMCKAGFAGKRAKGCLIGSHEMKERARLVKERHLRKIAEALYEDPDLSVLFDSLGSREWSADNNDSPDEDEDILLIALLPEETHLIDPEDDGFPLSRVVESDKFEKSDNSSRPYAEREHRAREEFFYDDDADF